MKNLKVLLALLAALVLVFAGACDSEGGSDNEGTDSEVDGGSDVGTDQDDGDGDEGTNNGSGAAVGEDYTLDENGSWTILTEKGLWAWAESADVLISTCTLGDDITLAQEWTPIGSDSSPYTGAFDGGGHTITGLTINASENYQGFFGVVGAGGTVKSLNLANVSIESSSIYVGAVAGENRGGTIEGCTVSGTVEGNNYVGGIVGRNYCAGYSYRGTVRGCSSSGEVASNGGTVGGIAGYNSQASIIACYSTADVTGGGMYVGGIAGRNYASTAASTKIIGSYYYGGKVSGTADSTGAVVGSNGCMINDCYWSGAVLINDEEQTIAEAGAGNNTSSATFDYTESAESAILGSSSSWSDAMSAMNSAISSDDNGEGWQYATNTDSSADVPLVLENTTSD